MCIYCFQIKTLTYRAMLCTLWEGCHLGMEFCQAATACPYPFHLCLWLKQLQKLLLLLGVRQVTDKLPETWIRKVLKHYCNKEHVLTMFQQHYNNTSKHFFQLTFHFIIHHLLSPVKPTACMGGPFIRYKKTNTWCNTWYGITILLNISTPTFLFFEDWFGSRWSRFFHLLLICKFT